MSDNVYVKLAQVFKIKWARSLGVKQQYDGLYKVIAKHDEKAYICIYAFIIFSNNFIYIL